MQQIADGAGGFPSDVLSDGDHFGDLAKVVGDLDGDGIEDIAVTAILDNDGATAAGAFYLIFLHANATVKRF